jgi:hypothetical protein
MIRIGFLPLYPSFRETRFRHDPVPEKRSPVHGFEEDPWDIRGCHFSRGGGVPGTNLKL